MAFVDDVLDEFDGQLRYQDIFNMTYKELGYLRQHRKEFHPQESKILAKALMNGQIPVGQQKGRPRQQSRNARPARPQRPPRNQRRR